MLFCMSLKLGLCLSLFEGWMLVRIFMLVFSPDDGGSMFIQNIGLCLQVHIALQLRTTQSSSFP